MALDLRDIRQSAHGEPEKLSAESPGYGFADRGLADTWRADETDDLALHRAPQFSNREEL